MMGEAAAKTWKRSALFAVLMSFVFGGQLSAQNQTQVDNYEIRVAGFKIGDLEAKLTKNGKNKNFLLQSEVSFWFFGKIFLNHEIDCQYLEDQLISSRVSSQSNRGDFITEIDWIENHYQVEAETYKYENSTTIQRVIEGSTAKFYFEKPQDGDEIVSETFGLLSEVKEVEKDVFEIEINGNRNRFYYSGQELTKVLIQNPIKNYVVQRVN